jgi:hypothetical protein
MAYLPGYGAPTVVQPPTKQEPMVESLRSMGAINIEPPLPMSPRLKSKITGVLYMWCESMAIRTELFVNCDEYGNEDPATWMNRMPEHYNSEPPVAPKPIPLHEVAKPIEGLVVGYMGDLD